MKAKQISKLHREVVHQLEKFFFLMPDDELGTWWQTTTSERDAKILLKKIGFWLNDAGYDADAPEALQIIWDEADDIIQSEIEERIAWKQQIEHERDLSGWI